MKKVQLTKPQQRKKKAWDYYLTGLNSKEIAKILECSHRTIQNYMTKEKWKTKRNKNNGL